MAKRKDLTMEEYMGLTKFIITQDKKAILKYFTKKLAVGSIHKRTLDTILELATESISFEITITIEKQFYDKYLNLRGGMLYTKEDELILSREEVEEYFEKDEIVIIDSSLFSSRPTAEKKILFELLEEVVGKDESDKMIKKIDNSVMFIYKDITSKYLILLDDQLITKEEEEINTFEQFKEYFQNEIPKIAIRRLNQKKYEINANKLDFRDDKGISYAILSIYSKILEELEKDTDKNKEKIEFMFSLMEKEHRRKNRLHQLDEMHEEIDKDLERFAKMEIDDLLDALISYQNIKNIIGESEFFDRMIEKTKEALKMIF